MLDRRSSSTAATLPRRGSHRRRRNQDGGYEWDLRPGRRHDSGRPGDEDPELCLRRNRHGQRRPGLPLADLLPRHSDPGCRSPRHAPQADLAAGPRLPAGRSGQGDLQRFAIADRWILRELSVGSFESVRGALHRSKHSRPSAAVLEDPVDEEQQIVLLFLRRPIRERVDEIWGSVLDVLEPVLVRGLEGTVSEQPEGAFSGNMLHGDIFVRDLGFELRAALLPELEPPLSELKPKLRGSLRDAIDRHPQASHSLEPAIFGHFGQPDVLRAVVRSVRRAIDDMNLTRFRIELARERVIAKCNERDFHLALSVVRLTATASATLMPSTPAERMPPA